MANPTVVALYIENTYNSVSKKEALCKLFHYWEVIRGYPIQLGCEIPEAPKIRTSSQSSEMR